MLSKKEIEKLYKEHNVPVPRFENYLQVNGGHLEHEQACHALFHYYTIAIENYKREVRNIRYDTEKDTNEWESEYNYLQLFKSIANIHGVDPSSMLNYWLNVSQQVTQLGLTHLPNTDKYRHNGRLEV